MTSGVKQPANTAAQVPTFTKTVVAFDATGFVQALSTCRDQGMETVPVFMQGVTVAAMATEAVDWDVQVQNLAHACRSLRSNTQPAPCLFRFGSLGPAREHAADSRACPVAAHAAAAAHYSDCDAARPGGVGNAAQVHHGAA